MAELNRKLRERLEREEKIEKAMGLGGAAIAATSTALSKLGLGGLADKLGLDAVNEKMREMAETAVANGEETDKFGTKMKILKGGIKEAGKNLIENLKDPLAITTFLAKEFVDALKAKYPHIHQPKKQDICYATQNRQDAVKFMAPQVDLVIVVGSPNSSNSNRLRELSEKLGVVSYMVDHPSQLNPEWFVGKKRIGLTAGASAPESLAQSIIDRIKELGPKSVRPLEGIVENTTFPLPKGLELRLKAFT
jgi:hypothetical protein